MRYKLFIRIYVLLGEAVHYVRGLVGGPASLFVLLAPCQILLLYGWLFAPAIFSHIISFCCVSPMSILTLSVCLDPKTAHQTAGKCSRYNVLPSASYTQRMCITVHKVGTVAVGQRKLHGEKSTSTSLQLFDILLYNSKSSR